MDVPLARRLAHPGWLNLRTVVGLALFAASVWAGARYLEAARTTSPAWAASRDLPSGTPLTAADVRRVEVNLPGDVVVRYLAGRTLPDGLVTTTALGTGELIPIEAVSDLSPPGPGYAIAIPVALEHAVGGALRPGDRVHVFATGGGGGPSTCTRLVAADVEVLELVEAGALVLDEGAVAGVTLAVTPEQAAALAHAVRTAEIDVARRDGAVGSPPPAQICRAGSGAGVR